MLETRVQCQVFLKHKSEKIYKMTKDNKENTKNLDDTRQNKKEFYTRN